MNLKKFHSFRRKAGFGIDAKQNFGKHDTSSVLKQPTQGFFAVV